MPQNRLGAAAFSDLRGPVAQLADERLHPLSVRGELGRRAVDSRLEDRH
jgi:hypothetical protein